MGGKLGTKETKEAFELGLAAIVAVQCSMADGKVTLGDIACVIPVFPKLEAGVDGLALVPAELGELDEADEQDLLAFCKAKLPTVTTDEHLRKLVYSYVKVGTSIANAVSVTREPKA